MGSFFDSIESELEGLERGGPTFAGDYNSKPAIIKQVQAAINALGYAPPLTVDGALGPATTAGIKWMQAQKGVAQDGIVGDQTLGSLGITPPGGTSVDSVTGAVTGAVSAALSALQSEFAPLISWATSNHQPITQGSGVASGFQATRASVINSYVDWTTPLEGFVPHMYIDALGFVTTGMGNLIDPMNAAMALPWKNANGSRATPAQIQAAWMAVDSKRSDPKGQKQTSGPATQGGGTQGGLTTIRITKDDVKALVADRLRGNEKIILEGLPEFAKAPADAQLAVHSMSWAEGPGFAKTWPQFDEAFNRGDFTTAAAQSNMQGTGIAMRNMANKLLFTNAAQVIAAKKNPDHLYYLDLSGLFTSGLIMSPAAIIADIKAHPLRTGIIGSIIALAVTTAVFMLKGQA